MRSDKMTKEQIEHAIEKRMILNYAFRLNEDGLHQIPVKPVGISGLKVLVTDIIGVDKWVDFECLSFITDINQVNGKKVLS